MCVLSRFAQGPGLTPPLAPFCYPGMSYQVFTNVDVVHAEGCPSRIRQGLDLSSILPSTIPHACRVASLQNRMAHRLSTRGLMEVIDAVGDFYPALTCHGTAAITQRAPHGSPLALVVSLVVNTLCGSICAVQRGGGSGLR